MRRGSKNGSDLLDLVVADDTHLYAAQYMLQGERVRRPKGKKWRTQKKWLKRINQYAPDVLKYVMLKRGEQ